MPRHAGTPVSWSRPGHDCRGAEQRRLLNVCSSSTRDHGDAPSTTTAQDHAHDCQREAVADDESQDVAARGADRPARADLDRALPHRVRDDAVDPEHGHEQRRQRESSRESGAHPLGRERSFHHFFDGRDAVNRQRGIDVVDRAADSGQQRVGAKRRAHDESSGIGHVDGARDIDLRDRRIAEGAVLHVADHADDLQARAGRAEPPEAPDRIVGTQIPRSRRLIEQTITGFLTSASVKSSPHQRIIVVK